MLFLFTCGIWHWFCSFFLIFLVWFFLFFLKMVFVTSLIVHSRSSFSVYSMKILCTSGLVLLCFFYFVEQKNVSLYLILPLFQQFAWNLFDFSRLDFLFSNSAKGAFEHQLLFFLPKVLPKSNNHPNKEFLTISCFVFLVGTLFEVVFLSVIQCLEKFLFLIIYQTRFFFLFNIYALANLKICHGTLFNTFHTETYGKYII